MNIYDYLCLFMSIWLYLHILHILLYNPRCLPRHASSATPGHPVQLHRCRRRSGRGGTTGGAHGHGGRHGGGGHGDRAADEDVTSPLKFGDLGMVWMEWWMEWMVTYLVDVSKECNKGCWNRITSRVATTSMLKNQESLQLHQIMWGKPRNSGG